MFFGQWLVIFEASEFDGKAANHKNKVPFIIPEEKTKRERRRKKEQRFDGQFASMGEVNNANLLSSGFNDDHRSEQSANDDSDDSDESGN